MKNHITISLKCFLLIVCGLLLAESTAAKTFTRTCYFRSMYYDTEDDAYYAYCEDGSRWKVLLEDGDISYRDDKGIFLNYGTSLELVSEKVFPANVKMTVNAGAGDQAYSTITIYSDGQSQDMTDINRNFDGSVYSFTMNDYTFDLNRDEAGTVSFSISGNNYYSWISVLVYSITLTYESEYGITITTNDGIDIAVTDDNKDNILNENTPTVQYDGVNMLTLNNADIAKITIGEMNEVSESRLRLFLKGENMMQNNTKAIVNESAEISMFFMTDASSPGSLLYTCTAGNLSSALDAFSGFDTFYYESGLSVNMSQEDGCNFVSVCVVLTDIVDKDHVEVTLNGASGEGIGEDIQDKTTAQLKVGCEVNNVLYTLPGNNDGYIDDESIIAADGKVVALNSSIEAWEVRNLISKIRWGDITPGSEEYAKSFPGLTFKIPAGTGVIRVEARTNDTGVLNVMIGEYNAKASTFSDAKTEFKVFEIPYAITSSCYVMIFNSTKSVSGSRRAPGRKETTTTEIRGIKVNASAVDETPSTPENGKQLTKDMVNAALQDGHIIIDDPDINSVNFSAFEDLQDKEVTYIDLSKTSIVTTLMRTNYPWLYIPANTLICLPPGSTRTLNSSNVVIGSVCEEMVMSDKDKSFETPVSFIAKVLKMDRDFSAYTENGCTVYLPFDLKEDAAGKVGSFYQFKNVRDDQVETFAVTSTEANKPYVLKGATGKLQFELVKVKPVASPSSSAASRRAAGGSALVGTYKKVGLNSTSDEQYYVYATSGDDAGKFVHVTETTTLTPYQAYLKVEGASYVDKMPVIIAPAYVLGDANGDEQVNVTDIVATVNYIMNKPSDDFNKYAADVNGDGEVNVTDIVGMVNIIMKSGTQSVREAISVRRRNGFI